MFAPLEGSELSRGAFPLSGLGIAISQSIIEAHGGQIGVASSAGESVLWFSLPLTPRNAP